MKYIDGVLGLIIACSDEPATIEKAFRRLGDQDHPPRCRVELSREFVIGQTRLRTTSDPVTRGTWAVRFCEDEDVLFEVARYTRDHGILSGIILNANASETVLAWIGSSSPLRNNQRIIDTLDYRRSGHTDERAQAIGRTSQVQPLYYSQLDADEQNEIDTMIGASTPTDLLEYLGGSWGLGENAPAVIPDLNTIEGIWSAIKTTNEGVDFLVPKGFFWEKRIEDVSACPVEYQRALCDLVPGLASDGAYSRIFSVYGDMEGLEIAQYGFDSVKATGFDLELGLELLLERSDLTLVELCDRLRAQARVINQTRD